MDELARLYTLVTGLSMTGEQILKAGERIHNLARCFNVKCGISRKDDYPPPRAFEDPLPDDVVKGAVIRREEYEEALDGYYECRGWSRDGIPLKKKLAELGLAKEAEEVGVEA
jgi:aldehyde:ferredoxin oxidoreductase